MTKFRVVIISFSGVLLAGLTAGILLLPHAAQAQGQALTSLTTTFGDHQETSFGDLAADALRSAGRADIGLVGAISFRTGTLSPGPVTAERCAELLANPDEVWAVSQLTGVQIKQALEHAVRSAPLPNNSFLQVSGLAFTYSTSPSTPRDRRVTSVLVGMAPLSDSATYRVAMPLSLAKGGSGFFKYFTEQAKVQDGTSSLAAAIVDFVQRQPQGTVSPTGTGRIVAAP